MLGCQVCERFSYSKWNSSHQQIKKTLKYGIFVLQGKINIIKRVFFTTWQPKVASLGCFLVNDLLTEVISYNL